ncbi:hypothetical protein F4779DRAFT_637729 [Xylariaceae sp. FL0662B]|nr:hypothetical protein F4779DRAFT_637729 [Xylariaceae sp. FL0662B]
MCRFVKHHAGCVVFGHATSSRATHYTQDFCAEALSSGVYGACDALVVDAEPDFYDAVCRRCAQTGARIAREATKALRRNLESGKSELESERQSLIGDALQAELALAAAGGSTRSPGSLPAQEVLSRMLEVGRNENEDASAADCTGRETAAEAAWLAQATRVSDWHVGTMLGMTEIFADWFTAAHSLVHTRAALRLAVREEDHLRVEVLRALAREREAFTRLLRRRLEYIGAWELFVEACL